MSKLAQRKIANQQAYLKKEGIKLPKNLSKKTELKTVGNYAKARGVTRETIYDWIRNKKDNRGRKMNIKVIDGCIFVVTSQYDMFKN